MQMYGGVEIQHHTSISAVDGRWAVGFTHQPVGVLSARVTWGNSPYAHWMVEGWASLRANLDTVAKGKILHCWELNPSCPAHSQSLYCLNYPSSIFVYEDSISYLGKKSNIQKCLTSTIHKLYLLQTYTTSGKTKQPHVVVSISKRK